MKRLMIAFSAAALLLASAGFSATAWAHGQGRGHHGHGIRHGHQFKPQHHGGFVQRPHFRPHSRHHFRPHRVIRRFHAPGHGVRILIVPGHGRHARPAHDRRFRYGFGGGHRRSWR